MLNINTQNGYACGVQLRQVAITEGMSVQISVFNLERLPITYQTGVGCFYKVVQLRQVVREFDIIHRRSCQLPVVFIRLFNLGRSLER